MMVTLNDLAAATGISKSTISRVINNEGSVKPSTRERVLTAVEELGYKPNVIARGMITGSLPIILAIVADIQNHFFTEMLSGLEPLIRESGYYLVVSSSSYDHEQVVSLINGAVSGHFAGIIPMTGFGSKKVIHALEKADCPVVLLNCHRTINEFDRIYGDDYMAAFLATKRLVSQGYERIVYLSGNSRTSVLNAIREAGFKAAMDEVGREWKEGVIFRNDFSLRSGYEFGRKHVRKGESIGICSNNFLMSEGVRQYLLTQGMSAKSDYGLAICEAPPQYYHDGDMISAGIDLNALGQSAAKLILNRLSNPHKPAEIVEIEPKLLSDYE